MSNNNINITDTDDSEADCPCNACGKQAATAAIKVRSYATMLCPSCLIDLGNAIKSYVGDRASHND